MNQLTTIPAEKATLVDIRTDNRRFPRLHLQKRGCHHADEHDYHDGISNSEDKQADAQTIIQMSSSHRHLE